MPVVVRDVSVSFGDRTVLDGVSCRFDEGELSVVRGPSGSGKSTLIALLVGHLEPDRGSVTVDVVRSGSVGRAPTVWAWVMQTANVFGRRTVADNVALPLRGHGMADVDARQLAEAAIADVGLAHRSGAPCTALSGGERQRVAVARALALEAPILIADEPTVALDRHNRDHLIDSLEAAAARGAVVIVATHDEAVVRRCDHVVDLGA